MIKFYAAAVDYPCMGALPMLALDLTSDASA
jgi:hypothetical protein